MGLAADGSQWPVMGMVPVSDLKIVDDWHAAGLRGTGSAIGLGKAALEGFLARLSERKITYTNCDSQREAPLTQFQVA